MSLRMMIGSLAALCGLFAQGGRAQDPPPRWETRHCLTGGFRVELPVGARVQAGGPVWADGLVRTFAFHTENADRTNFVSACLIGPADLARMTDAQARELLKKLSDATAAPMANVECVVQIERFFARGPGLDAIFKGTDRTSKQPQYLRVRHVKVGGTVYWVQVVGPSLKAVSSPAAMRFVTSLVLEGNGQPVPVPPDRLKLIPSSELPGNKAAQELVPSGTRELGKMIDDILRPLEAEVNLAIDDPTWLGLSWDEKWKQHFAALQRIDRELNDPKTPLARKVQLQRTLEASARLMDQAHQFQDKVHRDVLRSMKEIGERNTRAALRRAADYALIDAEFTRQAAADALWRAENDR